MKCNLYQVIAFSPIHTFEAGVRKSPLWKLCSEGADLMVENAVYILMEGASEKKKYVNRTYILYIDLCWVLCTMTHT